MGLFDKARERRAAAESRATQERQVAETSARQAAAARAVQDKLAAEAITELGKLSTRQGRDRRSLLAWEIAQRSLLGMYRSERAATSSFFARLRFEALQISEPPPLLAEFVPAVTPPPDRAVTALAEATQRFQVALDAHAEREQVRLKELRYTQNLYEQLLATERARQLQQQAEMWPPGVALEPEIASIWGIEDQVKAQNAKIDRQIHKLCDLLTEGLDALPATADTATNDRGQRDSLDARDVVLGLEAALTAMPLEPDLTQLRVAYSPESHQVVIEYELPEVKVVPTTKTYRYVKSRNAVVETARPQSQVKALYAGAIAQLTLLCLAVVFASDEHGAIDVAVFNGMVNTLDPRSGHPVRPCLITVRVTRDVFAAINLANVDPQACLKHLSAGVSKSPTELAPVRPVLEFSMVDPRFVDATDAISVLDDRPNLMELTPTQFEVLIQNLFTSMGLEARQTQASRDGGVDCVAYDTRPIFGGKVVIQAKRYKNTVGVSAVRDLYGTLQNEGASKGILVTTSGYGQASFDFASNKPIELIDGSNLLYLLETHAGVTARIEPPEEWRDPVPDSGETPQL